MTSEIFGSPSLSAHAGGGHRSTGRSRGARALAAAGLALLLPAVAGAASPALTKYLDPLPRPAVIQPVAGTNPPHYVVEMTQVNQKLHTQLPATPVWTYNGTYPGPTFDVRRNQLIEVEFLNKLPSTHLFPVDHTLPDTMHGAPDVRTVVHRHGGLQDDIFDGHPDAWFTPNQVAFGPAPPAFRINTYLWDNQQPPATIWYHDHSAGVTRLNVYAGLAGFYLIRDAVEDALRLPSGVYEVPLAIQDRTFNANGTLYYPGSWVKHFHGDTAVVNGMVWPYLEVEPALYRFRILDGSNARLYNLRLSSGQPFYQIGTDQGLMAKTVKVGGITMDPGERVDVIVDFRNRQGQKIRLLNGERGDGPDLAEIMEFRVKSGANVNNAVLPTTLRPFTKYSASQAVATRSVTVEHSEMDGAKVFLLDGKFRHDGITEIAKAGTVELWNVINLTGETHPIHTHLSEIQLLDRQPIDGGKYHKALMAWRDGGEVGPKPAFSAYLKGYRQPIKASENGNKDTIQSHGMSVTRMLVIYDDETGDTVWHCHILEHEDNDMMRPLRVNP